MISRATAEIEHHIDLKEVEAVVIATNAVQQGFRHDVLPYAKTFPLTGFDMGPLDHLINDARKVIETLHALIDERAKKGDGAAIIILYRNLHAVVQCKLAMDKWRRGLTQPVIAEAKYEMLRLLQVWVPVVRGLQYTSDLSFSQGIVYFHVGEHGLPEFTRYSYYYKGKAQPGSGSNKAPVSQAFIEARKAARSEAIPQGVNEWNIHANEIMKQLLELKEPLPPEGPPAAGDFDSHSWYRIKNAAKPGMALDVVNDGNQQCDAFKPCDSGPHPTPMSSETALSKSGAKHALLIGSPTGGLIGPETDLNTITEVLRRYDFRCTTCFVKGRSTFPAT
jgi:hypothetical protein